MRDGSGSYARALAGVALCALGLYAVLAFAARRRTAEFGLKSALGAPALEELEFFAHAHGRIR